MSEPTKTQDGTSRADWKNVGTVLLGSWPAQVASWGREGIAAYVSELEARGLSPDVAIVGLRSWEGKWPPSAGELAGSLRRDVEIPTFDEALKAILWCIKAAAPRFSWESDGHGTFISADDERLARIEGVRVQLEKVHPCVRSFAETRGIDQLSRLPLDDPDWGLKHRRDLERAWDNHVVSIDRRQVARLASGGGLGRLDPLVSLKRLEEGGG